VPIVHLGNHFCYFPGDVVAVEFTYTG
jgi:hypothetical protein